MERHEDTALREYEEKARELLDLTIDLCESRVSAAYARLLCCQERISHHWHEKLVALGFPQDLLPRAEDVRRGVRPGNRPAPIFPGLKKSKVQAQAQ